MSSPALVRLGRLSVALLRARDGIDDIREARDRAVLDAFDRGYTARQIGRAIGRSHVHVQRIVAARVIAEQEGPPRADTP